MKIVFALRFNDCEYYSELDDGEAVVLGAHKKDDVFISDLPEHFIALKSNNNILFIKIRGSHSSYQPVSTNELYIFNTEFGSINLYASIVTGVSKQFVNFPYNGIFTFGRKDDNDVILGYPIISGHHFKISVENNSVHIEDNNSTNGLYLNGKKIKNALMHTDDELSIYTFRFKLKDGVLSFENLGASLRFSDRISSFLGSAIEEYEHQSVLNDSSPYLVYHLSPRVREKMPTEDIVLSPVPEQAKAHGGKGGNFAYLMSSGAMMAASLATGIVSPAMLIARSAGMISPIANMARYGKLSKEEKQQLEEYEQLRQEKYEAYVSDQKAKIIKVANIQRRILSEENRSPVQLLADVNELRRNLWERMSVDDDFLNTRLGLGSIKLCVNIKTRAHDDEFRMPDDDDLAILAEHIIEETRLVDNSPVCVPFGQLQTVGIVGPADRIVYLLRAVLVEITAQHNYSDAKIVFLSSSSNSGRWGILRWLPHIWDETRQVRYISFDEQSKHIICELLGEIVRKRKNSSSDAERANNKNPLLLPHYIIIAENRDMISHEPIYEDLTSNNPNLGMTTIILSEDLYELPQKCQYIIDLNDRPYAYYRQQLNERLYFSFDELIHQKQMEEFSRRIAAIELEGLSGEEGIPNSISFLQGFGAHNVKELNIYERWENSEPYRTLAAPIGMMNGGKVFALDVMSGEGAHGPHGLLAGTTGSGKSELLQTWILSMAINYHPHDVNFVIIDYKGGGMSDLMEPLPHVVGKITNIDRNINRSLVALKSELKRRQELFAQAGVNNIGKYQRAYKNGDATEPLPHLIIVTDEFAEMKKEEPEFMTELNSVATVGRSLGIHMLLATQKPAGVVTDQINSNSRFRICMKVQDVSDSREMLKRPDAAKITQSGRAYYRIGEDEDFGLFQSFYSGAEYIENKQDVSAKENQVRIVGVTGNRINPIEKKSVKSVDLIDELSAVISEIKMICEQKSIDKMPGPWLPELPKWLPLADIGICTDDSPINYSNINDGIVVPIGMYDIPSKQLQGVHFFNLSEMGHCGIYGIPGSGKTTFLKTLLTAIGFTYRPEEISITILDAGSWSMSEFIDMPHVKDVILNQDQNKIDHFIKSMKKELEVRKSAFVINAVNSLTAYRTSVSSNLPAILIIVDGIAQMFEQYIQFDELMNEIAASGSTYGIHIVFTNNTSTGIKYKFSQLIKGSIALQLPDKGDYINLVGSVNNVSLPSFPGRSLFKGNPPISVQLAVYSDKVDELERHSDVEVIISKITDLATDNQKDNNVSVEDNKSANDARTTLSVGTDINTLDIVKVDLHDNYVLLISCENSNMSKSFLVGLEKLIKNRNDNQVIHINNENYIDVISKLVELLNDRKKQKKQQVWTETHTESDWLAGYMQICLFIDDADRLVDSMGDKDIKMLRRIITMSGGLGVIVIASCSRTKLNSSNDDILFSALAESKNIIGIGKDISEHTFIRRIYDEFKWICLEEDEAFVITDNHLRVIKISKEVQ